MEKRFALKLIIVAMTLLGAIAVINRVVDPFYYYRDLEIKGINQFKPKAGRYERYTKPALLIQKHPNALIFGNSISEIAFNPDNQYFNDSNSLQGYNFSFAESPWDKVFCHFQFALNHTSIKRALIGISLNDMARTDCSAKSFYKNMGDISHKDLLLTGSALNASIQTIVEQKHKVNSHAPNGLYFYARNKGGVNERFRNSYKKYIETNQTCQKHSSELKSPSEKINLDGLIQLIDLAHQKNIELTIYIYPEHAYTLELEKLCGTLDLRWDKLKQLADALQKPLQENNLQAWHFYGYNPITTEFIGDKSVYWQDSFHVNYEMGNLMLEDMYSKNPKRLGTPITKNNISNGMTHLMKQREIYLNKNSQGYENFNNLLPENLTN